MAHGQPSDSEPAEGLLAVLAGQVRKMLPGWRVLSSTLATPGRLEAAARALPGGAVIFPLFMAGGWFVKQVLPVRLKRHDLITAAPLGLLPGLPDTAAAALTAWAGIHDRPAGEILLAAHGSARGQAASGAAEAFARRLRARLPEDAEVRTGYLEQAPFLADAARDMNKDAICLPFFALPGEHVRRDLPAVLEEAGFRGRILPVLGQAAGIPALIARTILDTAQEATP